MMQEERMRKERAMAQNAQGSMRRSGEYQTGWSKAPPSTGGESSYGMALLMLAVIVVVVSLIAVTLVV
jgi:hypothetical protein